jgi:hypothetical protein
MLGATDEEVERITRIELATQEALAEMGAYLESEVDRYERLLEITAVERDALVEILGEDRATLYSWLRAQEVEEEVLGIVGGLPNPLPSTE